MYDDKRMPELLADMLIKLDKLDKLDILVEEMRGMKEEMRDMKREQLRTTNAVWELSQMMQKVLWEPVQKTQSDIAEIKERLDILKKKAA